MKLEEKILDILQKNNLVFNVQFSKPPKSEMGDLCFPCFELAKKLGENPVMTAQKIKDILDKENLSKFGLDKSVVNGPYVNFYLNNGFVAEQIIGDILKQGKKYGQNNSGGNKKVIIEYPSNNTHKELHIGHLRVICLGNALTNLFALNGFKVDPINYLNDFGAHVAKCLWGLEKFHKGEKPPKGQEQKWLGEIYSEASLYLADHPEEKDGSINMQKLIEARDKSIWPLFKTTRQWSIDGFSKAFKELGLKLKYTFYEQDVKDSGQKVVDQLLKNKIATVGEGGAIIVDLSPYKLDIALLRKSNGAGLYITSDLGLALAKNKKYPNIIEAINLTGSEQDFYFKQLFKVLELAGYEYKMTHVGCGLVMLPDGKMSSRKGKVVLYEDVRNMVYDKVLEETKKRHSDWSEKKIKSAALKIAFAAIKFDFLKHEAAKTIVFDDANATKFEGFTGPYTLYMVARINSILRKVKLNFKKSDLSLLVTNEEKQLLLMLGQYGEIIIKAFQSYNPSVLTKYAFDVAAAFSNFYAKQIVINQENKELTKARLALCAATKQVIENCLTALSIETVDEM